MKNKKMLIIITISSFVVIFIAVYFFVINKMVKQDFLREIKETVGVLDSNDAKENSVELEKIECKFSSNQEIVIKSIESGNGNFCKCISEENEKNDCISKTNDIKTYRQAFDTLNLEVCSSIKDDVPRQACQSGVKNALENAENNSIVEKKDLTIEDYEKIRELEPNNVENLISLARSYSQKIYTEDEGGTDRVMVDKVLSILDECKKYNANNVKIYELEGYIWEAILEHDKSLVAYNKGLELDSNNLNLLVGRSRVYISLNKKNEALMDLEKAAILDVSKENKDIYMTLCNIYASMANREKAKENCQIIISSEADGIMKDEALKTVELIK